MNIKILCLPALSLTLLLTGCASDSKRVVDLNLRYMTADSAPINSTDANAQAQLSEAATSVGQSLQELSAVQLATHPGVRMSSPMQPAGMGRIASLDWTGPVEGVVKQIGRASGYQVRVLGDRPAIVPIVVLASRNQPIADILRNVQYQVAGKADINVYGSSRVIELRYRSNSQ